MQDLGTLRQRAVARYKEVRSQRQARYLAFLREWFRREYGEDGPLPVIEWQATNSLNSSIWHAEEYRVDQDLLFRVFEVPPYPYGIEADDDEIPTIQLELFWGGTWREVTSLEDVGAILSE